MMSKCYNSINQFASEQDGQLFLIACWFISKARNEELFLTLHEETRN